MKIAIDIDGALNNIHELMSAYGNYYDMSIVKGIGAICPKEKNIKNMFGWTDEQYRGFIKKYMNEILITVNAKPFCAAVMDKLIKEGNEIYLITERNQNMSDNVIQITQNWLMAQKIPYNKLIMECGDKLTLCKDKEIRLLIDDEPESCLKVSEEIPVICFDAVYNQEVHNEMIMRVLDWIDIYKIMQKLRWDK